MKRFKLPYLSLQAAARYLSLKSDTLFWLTQKGVFSPEWRAGKMFFRTEDVVRMAKEEKR